MLGFETRGSVDGFLKARGVYDECTVDDIEQDLASLHPQTCGLVAPVTCSLPARVTRRSRALRPWDPPVVNSFEMAAPPSDAESASRGHAVLHISCVALHTTIATAGMVESQVRRILGSGAECLAISCRRRAAVLLEKSGHMFLVGKPASERDLDDAGISLA